MKKSLLPDASSNVVRSASSLRIACVLGVLVFAGCDAESSAPDTDDATNESDSNQQSVEGREGATEPSLATKPASEGSNPSGQPTGVPKGEENAPASSPPAPPDPAKALVILVNATNPKKRLRTSDFVDANGRTSKSEYNLVRDAQKRVVGYGVSTTARWTSYGYDGASKRIKSVTDSNAGWSYTQSFRFDNAGRIVEKLYAGSSQGPYSAAKDVYEYNDSASRISVSRFAVNGSKLSTSIFDLKAMTETFSSDTANYTVTYALVGLASSADDGPIFTAPSWPFSRGSGNGSQKPTYAVPPPHKCSFAAATRRHICERGDSNNKYESEFSIVRFETPGESPSYAAFTHRAVATSQSGVSTQESQYNGGWGLTKRIDSRKFRSESSAESVWAFASDPFNPVEVRTASSNGSKTVGKYTYFED